MFSWIVLFRQVGNTCEEEKINCGGDAMDRPTFRVYGYRWVVLAVFMFINITIQMLWISYSPITGPAATFYGVTDLNIGLLSMMFMIAFIPLSIPVSWAIDTWGFHKACLLYTSDAADE